jgi:DAACS family dicarboxylate/amino acid:cation (Na+ or H+) symporter
MDTHNVQPAAAGDAPAEQPAHRKAPAHTPILLGLALGAVAGLAANWALGGNDTRLAWFIANITEPIGQLFLRLLLLTVIPLVFACLVVGIAQMGDLRRLGRVGLKTLGYTLVMSAISVVIGLTLANTIRPGTRVDPAVAQQLEERFGGEAKKRVATQEKEKPASSDSPLMTVVKTLVPTNPLAAVASDPPNMLHLMFFAVLLGVAVTMVGRERVTGLIDALEGLAAVSMRLVDIAMRVAPVAVACLVFTNVARFGFDLLSALGWYVVTVLGGLALHLFVVYSAAVYFLAGINPLDFFRRVKTAMLTAFSTSSSNATLPTALRVSEENLGVPREINSFVLTVGATANQNGTALYEGVTVLFLAQLAGIDLPLGMQIMVAYMAILGGVGTAGVPAGSIPFVILVLMQVGVNPELIAIVLGVDRLLDMCRTTLNVTGDIAAAAYVARSEGHALLPTVNGAPAAASD